MNDPDCQWTVAVGGRNLRCDFEAGHGGAHCNAETGHIWYPAPAVEMPIEEAMRCTCDHNFNNHPIDNDNPFAWPCTAPECYCQWWEPGEIKQG